MADENATTRESVTISIGDIAAIAFQMFIAWSFSALAAYQPFHFAFVAYIGLVASLSLRSKKHGLTAIDRKVIVFSFFPIFFFAIYLSMQIWKWQYPAWVFQ